MLFAFVYAAIGTLGSNPFFAQVNHATISDYLYFSFITLTTVGYGDLTAAGGFGRASAVMEALLGQIYLVTVVAVLVGAIGHRRLATPSPAAEDTVRGSGPA
jgi:voltage-gated potassium channel Kch